MGLEVATYIGNLVSANPTGADRKLQGDDHIRLLKSVLQNCFGGFTGAILTTGTNGGVANAYTLTPTVPLAGYVVNMGIIFTPTISSSGPSTINVSGLGAVEIRSVDGAALIGSDLVAGRVYEAIFDGTFFILGGVTKRYIDQLAFSAALPLQTGNAGKFLITNGTDASWTDTFGVAVNEIKGADIASAPTVNLTTATGNLVHITGTTTITAITIPSGAEREVVFDGILTLTNSASLILPLATNIITAAGDCATIRGDGVGVARVVKYERRNGLGDHEVIVHTGNGYGSTNTKIRRFTTTMTSVGTAITYADSAANGATFTINEAGIYAISYTDTTAGASQTWGASLNSAQLTTNVTAINVADRIAGVCTTGSGGALSVAARVLKLAAGDIVRPHTNGEASPGANNLVLFAIRKVGLYP